MNNCKAITWPPPSVPPRQKELLRALLSSLNDEQRLLSLAAHFDPAGDYPLAPHCYSRSLLLRSPDGAEVMVARWDKGATTPIHGHPRYAFVYVLQGLLQVVHYRDTPGGLEADGTHLCPPGNHIYAAGTEGRFDNAIHRVTALEASLSLHVYSDDALKGICYD